MERSSFFNAELKGEEYDRVYLAEDYARYFASFIGNGVFPTPSTNLQVVADGNTMNLTLKQGKAWINGYFYENTDNYNLKVDVADGVLNRIDRVVVRLDFINREIKTYIKKGAFASSPVAPKLQRDADVYELGIADIKINKGVTKLVQANITDLRHNNNYCGLVAGVVKQIDTTNLFNQFQSTFDIWFKDIKGQLSTDAAGNLQLQINNSKAKIEENRLNILKCVKRTTSDMQIYVKLTGNDTTGDGSFSNPYRTIQKAIDSLPKYIEHIITINIDAGEYAETVGVNGFIGRGEIRILGATSSADTHIIASLSVSNCSCPIFITGLRGTRISSANFNVEYCQFVKFNYCKAINSADQSAFRFFGSKGMTEFCEVRNRQYGLIASRSEVYSSEWFSNSGNNVYGLYATEGGKISKNGAQPIGTTASETSIKGGQIL